MTSKAERLKKEAQEKVRQYEELQQAQRLKNLLLLLAVTIVVAFFFLLFSGQRYAHILGYFGLSGIHYERTGAYIDCRERENRNHDFCRPRAPRSSRATEERPQTRAVRDQTKGPPFSLHGN